MARYMIDAQRELAQVLEKIASNRKTAQHNPNPKSAAIADATLPSLERKRVALEAEIAAGLPDRPPLTFGPSSSNKTTPRDLAVDPWTVADDAACEIPDFLRRSRR